ncbi:MAG TPA: hypothetical protein VND64_14995, partial [Pirellulales bacterium]|nr:hypothetical protein [Pirellulales bacterium]
HNVELRVPLRFYSSWHGWQGAKGTALVATIEEIDFDARPRRLRAIPLTSPACGYPQRVARLGRKAHPPFLAKRFRTDVADNDRGAAKKTDESQVSWHYTCLKCPADAKTAEKPSHVRRKSTT